MPKNEPRDDAVITRLTAARDAATAAVASTERRLETALVGVVHPNGQVRSGRAAECAVREIELKQLRLHADAAEAALAAAVKDLPRREKERADAAKLDADAAKLDADAAKLRAQLDALESERAKLVADADRHRRRSEFSMDELESRRAAFEAARAETEASNARRRNAGLGPDPLPEIPAFIAEAV